MYCLTNAICYFLTQELNLFCCGAASPELEVIVMMMMMMMTMDAILPFCLDVCDRKSTVSLPIELVKEGTGNVWPIHGTQKQPRDPASSRSSWVC